MINYMSQIKEKVAATTYKEINEPALKDKNFKNSIIRV